MAKQTALQRAVRDMAQGSKQAFRVFYLSTIPYIYSSARLLYESHEQACGFTIDVYQYLYLHLPEYRAGEDLEKWISKHMMERYSQLSIGRPLPTHSVRTQSQSTALILEESERERIWRQLSAKIHFPKEQQCGDQQPHTSAAADLRTAADDASAFALCTAGSPAALRKHKNGCRAGYAAGCDRRDRYTRCRYIGCRR